MWALCCSCHRVAQLKAIPRAAKLRCSSCGGRAVRSLRKIKTSMLNGGQTEPGAAKVLTYAGLLSIAQQRGYKVGYASAKFRDIFGHWPDAKPEPQNPSPELLWWVKAQAKAWGKAQNAAGVPKPLARTLTDELPIEIARPYSELMTDEDWSVKL
jgi:hypothetical protein